MLNEILNSMNLPASLKEKSAAVIEAGGVDELEMLVRELPDPLQRSTALLSEAESLLREEEGSDITLGAQHGARWSRTPSDKLTETFSANATNYRTRQEEAMDWLRSVLQVDREYKITGIRDASVKLLIKMAVREGRLLDEK